MLCFAPVLAPMLRRQVVRRVHVEKRIAELGHELPPLGTPKGSYALTSRCGSLLFLSGHLPIPLKGVCLHPDTLERDAGELYKGKVGVDYSIEEAQEAAKWCGLNIISTLKSEVGDLDNVVKIHKLVAFVNCRDDFTAQPTVVNGCSDLLVDVFGEKGRHARSAVGTNSLPLNVPVEIEAIVEVSS